MFLISVIFYIDILLLYPLVKAASYLYIIHLFLSVRICNFSCSWLVHIPQIRAGHLHNSTWFSLFKTCLPDSWFDSWSKQISSITSMLYSTLHVYFIISNLSCFIPFFKEPTQKIYKYLVSWCRFTTIFGKKDYHGLPLTYLLQDVSINSVKLWNIGRLSTPLHLKSSRNIDFTGHIESRAAKETLMSSSGIKTVNDFAFEWPVRPVYLSNWNWIYISSIFSLNSPVMESHPD